jgi:hypothetical protein
MIPSLAVRSDRGRLDIFRFCYDHASFGCKSGDMGPEQLDSSYRRIGADAGLSPGKPAEPRKIDSAAVNIAVRAQSRFLPDHDKKESIFILE